MRVPLCVALFSAGEMGSRVGSALREAGVEVRTSVAGRSVRTAEAARAAGLVALDSVEGAIRGARLVISIVPSAAAVPVARAVASATRTLGEGLAPPLYLDANSISPTTAGAVATIVQAVGMAFVDGALIGPAAGVPERTRLYLAGAEAAEVATLLAPPLQVEVLGPAAGQASAFKVLYAGLTKGLSALGVELLAGATRLDLRDVLLDTYRADFPDVVRFWERILPGLPERAGRRAQEMAELAGYLEELGLSNALSRASQAVLARLAAERQAPDAMLGALPDLAVPSRDERQGDHERQQG